MTKEPWIVEIDGEMLSEIKSKEEQEWMVTSCWASGADGFVPDMQQLQVVGTAEQVLDYIWKAFSNKTNDLKKHGAKMLDGSNDKDRVFVHRSDDNELWIQEEFFAKQGYPIFYLYSGLFENDYGVKAVVSIQAEMLLKNKRIQL